MKPHGLTCRLPLAEPPSTLVHKIYREARRSIPWRHSANPGVLGKQNWLRQVSLEFHKRLAAAGIYVEGCEY